MGLETTRTTDRPIIASLVAILSVLLLGITTVWGAFATNWHVGAGHRALIEREKNIAEEFSLDLDALRRGRTEFMKTCTACHGPNGEAKPNLGKDLRDSTFIAEKSDSGMLMFLKLGRNTWDSDNTTGVAMPPKGGNPMINDDGLRDLVQYLRFIQANAKAS